MDLKWSDLFILIFNFMKKFFYSALVASAFLLSACAPTPQKLVDKIQSGEELSEKDYTVAFDYSNKMLDIINDSIAAHQGDFPAIIQALKNIDDEYPEANIIVQQLLATDPATLDEKNRQLYDNLIKNIDAMTASVASEGPVIRHQYASPDEDLNSDETLKADSLVVPASNEVKLSDKNVAGGNSSNDNANSAAKAQ